MNNRRALFAQAIRGPILLITIGVLFAMHQAGVLSFLADLAADHHRDRSLEVDRAHGGAPIQSTHAAAGRAAAMRTRGSITGPLILIAIGVLFLLHAISPNFRIGEMLAQYWPYLLIVWGVIELIEIAFRALARGSDSCQWRFRGRMGAGGL